MKGEAYTVTFTSAGTGPEMIIRLRRMLKISLRSFGLRCMAISEVEDSAMAIPGDGKANLGDAGLGTTQSTPDASARQKEPLLTRHEIQL